MKIHFSVSEAQIEPNDLTGIPPIDPNQAAFMTLEVGNEPIQMTYGALRTGPHGKVIARHDQETEFWEIVCEVEPDSLEDHYGRPHTETTRTTGLKFTDWTVTSDAAPASDALLTPEELEVLAEDHWNDGCALTIESRDLAAIPEDERGTAQSIVSAVAEGGEPPFRLTLLTNGLGDVYKIKKEYLND